MADFGDADGPAPPALLVWGLAAFHAALLVALVVGLLYVAGVAGEQLAALDTSIGVVAYLYLWGVTWWTNRRWLAVAEPGFLSGTAARSTVVAGAVMWGGVAGLFVFLPAFVVGALLVGASGGIDALPFLVLAAAIGAALSAGVGAVVGSAFALLDMFLLRAARTWLALDVDASADAEPRTTE